jgi:hypothetical protein
VDKLDEAALKALKKVDPPAILNVHRWSIEEDLCLLRAVPVLGHMWAELSTRLVPHRDRGHLRKRYQVLERRVKATVTRANKEGRQKSTIPSPQRSAPQFLKKRANKAASPSHYHYPQHPHQQHIRHYETAPSPIVARQHKPLRKPGHHLPVSHHQADYHHYDHRGHLRGAVPNQFDDCERDESRMEFERMLNNEDDEWSQMSRVKKMIVDDHSMMGVNKLTDAAVLAERMNPDPGHSHGSDGLSLLVAGARESEKASSSSERGPILASVLGHSQRDEVLAPAVSLTPLSSPDKSRRGFSPGYKSILSPPLQSQPPSHSLHGWESTSSVGGTESNHFDPSYFEISDKSRQAFASNNASSKFDSTGLTPTHIARGMVGMAERSNLHHPTSSLAAAAAAAGAESEGLRATGNAELDAVAALSNLSSSPARFETEKTRAKTSSVFGDDNTMGGVKRSLFDNVLKRADRKKPKH